MKAFDFIEKHKYKIVVCLLFIMVGVCFLLVLQGMKKDHSLELTNERLKLKEENRLQIEKQREAYEEQKRELENQNAVLRIRDSLVHENILLLNAQLDKLSNRYNEKAKIINGYGSDDLREYFRNLPKQPDNDY